MSRQLRFDFESPAQSSAPTPDQSQSVAEIAAALQPRLLEHLKQASGPVAIGELRSALGHPNSVLDGEPQSNPVNYLLREMRDRKEVICNEAERGDPTFVLPPESTDEEIETFGDDVPVSSSLPLLRPDRQCTFEGALHFDWPEPEHHRDCITVDRIRDDIDGPSHRFTIHRGDTVEAFFSKEKIETGEVVGISHARNEVRVRFREATNGIWFSVGQIYPAVEPEANGDETVPLSTLTETVSQEPPAGFTEADTVFHEPYSMETFREYRGRYEAGESSLCEHRMEVARLRATHDDFVTGLTKRYDATQLKGLASRFGCFDARRNSKPKNAEHVYRVLLQSFTLGNSIQYDPMRETLDDAVAREIAGLTEDDWRQHLVQRAAEREQNEQAISDPETIEQFRIFMRERGVEALSDDQRIRFDELLADQSRQLRAETQTKATVSQISDEVQAAVGLTIKEGYHDRQQCKLWIVQMSERVSREMYQELKRKAKMLGGWYSSFKQDDAGFQFKTQKSAEKFRGLLDGDADRRDELADRKTRKMDRAGDHLTVLAETLEQDAEETLAADEGKLKNTVRRSEMAAGVRGRAYANQAMAGTFRQIAAALDSGEATYIDGVRTGTQVSALVRLLRRGKTKRNQTLLEQEGELGVWDRHRKTEELDHRPLAREDAAFAEYPFPSVSRHHFQDLLAAGAKTKGVKQQSRRLKSFAIGDREKHFIEFVDQHDIELLLDYLRHCKEKRLDTQWVDYGLDDYKRMRAVNIHTPQELRCALRELVPHLRKKKEDDPVAKAEQALVGLKIPGFFPTPRPVISRMLEMAEIGEGDRVLEPSAGKGDILDMIREHHPDTVCTAIEMNGALLDVIRAKSHEVMQGDFLQHEGQYDVVLMNPPFENGQDIDHVRHAFDQLASGGRLVAVMSHGPFFRNDRKATEFREWLGENGGNHEELPDDAFKGPQAFRQTGVRTQIVEVKK